MVKGKLIDFFVLTRLRGITSILWVVIFFCCSSKDQCRVKVTIKSGHGKKLYLSALPLSSESSLKVYDSIIIQDVKTPVYFSLPRNPMAAWQISFSNSGIRYLFFNDNSSVEIQGDFISGNFSSMSSPATTSFNDFVKSQTEIAEKTRNIYKHIQQIKQGEKSSPSRDSLVFLLSAANSELSKRYISYCDTVQNPAAFMVMYNSIDFANDYKGLRKFIDHAANRFNKFEPVQELKSKVLEYLSIFESEYQIGDSLPVFQLPDEEGNIFQTASLKGQYYFIDFWSTWCPQCKNYDTPKRKLRGQFPNGKLAMVSVAIDSEKEAWENFVRGSDFKWTQLIDEKMWQGVAVRTIKFDSIPFNYLVDPSGKILAKGIPPDSLLLIAKEKIK